MFSEIVDLALAQTSRKQLTTRAAGFLNNTIRECIVKDNFRRDMVEDNITATSANYVWTHPRSFKAIKAIEYPGVVFPIHNPPGRGQRDEYERLPTAYFYLGTDYVVFNGTANGDVIKIAYMTLNKSLNYYAAALRPAVFDREAETWTYLDGSNNYVATLGSDALDEAARVKVHHWLLDIWPNLCQEGTVAKLLKSINSQQSSSSFALYKDQQRFMRASEATVDLNYGF